MATNGLILDWETHFELLLTLLCPIVYSRLAMDCC